MKRWTFVAATIGAAFLAACGGSGGSGYSTGPTNTPTGGGTGGGTSGNPNTNQVTMVDQSFSPGTVTIPKGVTVTWTWPTCDTTGGYGGYGDCITHSVVFDDGVQSSVQSTGTFARTFNVAGTFNYHCGVHGTAMSAKVIVQ